MLYQQPTVRPLADSELPLSVHAHHAWSGVSEKYAHVDTLDVVHALANVGIHPYLAKSSRTKLVSKVGYTKHMLRFRQDNQQPLAGGIYPEVVIVNSHDRGSSFRADLGLYRLICKNGLVANYGTLAAYRGIHVALRIEDVLAGVQNIIAQFPRVVSVIEAMQRKTLNAEQRTAFAQAAALLRWDSDKLPFESSVLLTTRREEDSEPTIWNVFNAVQENLTQGQRIRTYGPSFSGYRRVTRSTRAVGSIDVDMKINSGLWSLASELVNSKEVTATA